MPPFAAPLRRFLFPPPRYPLGFSCLALPRLSYGDKKQLGVYAADFRESFITNATSGAMHSIFQSAAGGGSFRAVDLDFVLNSSLLFGLDMSLFPFLYNSGIVVLKPNITAFPNWIAWTASIAAVTTIVETTVTTVSHNFVTQGRFSLDSWTGFGGHPRHILHSMGFHIGAGASQYYLPPPDRLGGPVTRYAAIMASALGTAQLFEYPFGWSLRDRLRAFLTSLPIEVSEDWMSRIASSGMRRLE
jgi:hypothetical protein